MSYIIGADKFVSEQIKNMKYTDNIKTWDVSTQISIGWDDVLPDPPMNDSETTKKELVYLSELTKSLSSSQMDLIKLVDKEPNDLFHKTMRDLNIEFPQEISSDNPARVKILSMIPTVEFFAGIKQPI